MCAEKCGIPRVTRPKFLDCILCEDFHALTIAMGITIRCHPRRYSFSHNLFDNNSPLQDASKPLNNLSKYNAFLSLAIHSHGGLALHAKRTFPLQRAFLARLSPLMIKIFFDIPIRSFCSSMVFQIEKLVNYFRVDS
jgi:hypothetical protein